MVGLAARCGPGRGARCLRLQVRSGRVSVRVYYVRLYVRMAFSETQTTLTENKRLHTADITSLMTACLISEHLQVFGRNGHPYSMASILVRAAAVQEHGHKVLRGRCNARPCTACSGLCVPIAHRRRLGSRLDHPRRGVAAHAALSSIVFTEAGVIVAVVRARGVRRAGAMERFLKQLLHLPLPFLLSSSADIDGWHWQICPGMKWRCSRRRRMLPFGPPIGGCGACELPV